MFDDLKLYALEAVASAEAWAREQLLITGKKVLSEDKKQFAVKVAVSAYKSATAGIPILNVVDWDDNAVRDLAARAIDWAFAQLESILNNVARALPEPTTTAPELPTGGLQ